MRHTRLGTQITSESSEADLLLACRAGSLAAVEPLLDRHLPFGVGLALELASPELSDEELLDQVHDAFITAFDEALESDDLSLTSAFHGLIRMFVGRNGPTRDASRGEWSIETYALRELRAELARELRVMIEINVEAPHARKPAQRLLAEVHALRHRLELRIAVLRSNGPNFVVDHGDRHAGD